MNYRRLILLLSLIGLLYDLSAQMLVGQDTLYGYEWIRFDQPYYKIEIAKDGLCRITYDQLLTTGIPADQIRGDRWQLFRLGQEVPLHTTTDEEFGPGDYIEFYGEQLRGELDRFLFPNPDLDQLNPAYSLITDTCVYFLTRVTDAAPQPLRWTTLPVDYQNLPPADTWARLEAIQLFTNQLHKRYYPVSGSNIYFSHFDGDGFASPMVQHRSLTLPLPNRFHVGPDPELILHSISNASVSGHDMQVLVNNQEVIRRAFTGVEMYRDTLSLSGVSVGDTVQLNLSGLAGSSDRYATALAVVRYPAELVTANALRTRTFVLPESPGERHIQLEASGSQTWLLLDPEQRFRQTAVPSGGVLTFRLPPAEGERSLILLRMNDVIQVDALQECHFADPAEAQKRDFVILSGGTLLHSAEIQEYADYRASQEGGGFSVHIQDVEALYDLYAYGIRRHPLAVKNYAIHLDHSEKVPRYVFIIGKGREYNAIRTTNQFNTAVQASTFFVPTFGWPGSDNLLFSRFIEGAPLAAIGRLSAMSGAEIGIYLKKIREYEGIEQGEQTIEDQWWKKHLLHLGGGSSLAEQSIIRFNLGQMADMLEQSNFGAHTSSFYKSSTDPVQESVSAQIFSVINAGVSLISFFGHSTASGFDFNVDNLDRYENHGRYPVMIALGCATGNVFTPTKSIGERFIFAPEKGAIAFGATLGLGFVNALRQLGQGMYREWGEGSYSIGEGILRSLRDIGEQPTLSIRALTQQFAFQGDPAIDLIRQPGPDYIIDAGSVRIEPDVLNNTTTHFSLSFELLNLGTYLEQWIPISIGWESENGDIHIVQDILLPATHGSIRAVHEIAVEDYMQVGRNRLHLWIDPEGLLTELPLPGALANNELYGSDARRGWPVRVVDNSLRPVWPPDMSIWTDTTLVLSASTTDPLASIQTYVLEVDTVVGFNSPQKLSTRRTQTGGLVQWTPESVWMPGQTYYWRVSPDSLNAEQTFRWESASFTYLPDMPEGWRQQDAGQWLQKGGGNIFYDDSVRIFRFPINITDFQVKNKLFDNADRPSGFMNNVVWSDFFRWEVHESLNITVFDTLGRVVWNDRPGQYGSLNTTASKEIACFPFPVATPEQRLNILHFLDSIIPDGYLIMLWTAIRTAGSTLKVDEWASDSLVAGGINIFNLLEAQGAERIRELEQGVLPYIFAYIKGDQVIGEVIADTITSTINLSITVPGFWTSGAYHSPLIGPASRWDDFSWDYTLQHSSDSLYAEIFGITTDGEYILLLGPLVDTLYTLEHIDAGEFPFMQLRFAAWDPVESTVPDIGHWQVNHRHVSELAVAPAHYLEWNGDGLQIGDSLRLTFSLHQLSTMPSDSIQIRYLLSRPGMAPVSVVDVMPGPGPRDSVRVGFSLPTAFLQPGDYQLSIEVEPGLGEYERYNFNNTLVLPVRLFGDQVNPLLDVTFDGVRIADGELVSPVPEIGIRLFDENLFFPLADAGLLTINLTFPDGSLREVRGDDPDVIWEAAGPGISALHVKWRPVFVEEGLYHLEVQGRDESGNLSGDLYYRVSFRVLLEQQLSNIRNYPNPFSSYTWFEYTLSGEPAASLQIEILTPDGRLARTISLDQGIPSGTRRLKVYWDGMDYVGTPLPSGVYYYRVRIVDNHGSEVKLRRNSNAINSNNAYGVLMIVR